MHPFPLRSKREIRPTSSSAASSHGGRSEGKSDPNKKNVASRTNPHDDMKVGSRSDSCIHREGALEWLILAGSTGLVMVTLDWMKQPRFPRVVFSSDSCSGDSFLQKEQDDLVVQMKRTSQAADYNNQPPSLAKIHSDDSLSCADQTTLTTTVEAKALSSLSQSESSLALKTTGTTPPRRPSLKRQETSRADVEYFGTREMTHLQEQWNALSMVPIALLGWYFLLSRAWLDPALVDQARQALLKGEVLEMDCGSGVRGTLNTWLGDAEDDCCWPLTYSNNHSVDLWSFSSLPPLPTLALMVGVLLHSPFSFLYHWSYAPFLKPKERVEHWSRRMDHFMIHIASAFFSYGTSGNIPYFLLTLLYNTESAMKHFEPQVVPKRNQMRVSFAIAGYAMPMLWISPVCFVGFWCFMGTGMWLFSQYPLGGWSHTAFHFALVAALLPMYWVSCMNHDGQAQVRLAAYCQARTEVSRFQDV